MENDIQHQQPNDVDGSVYTPTWELEDYVKETFEENETIIEEEQNDTGSNMSGSIVGFTTKTIDEMYDLYCQHAKEIGFGVRKSTTRCRGDGVVLHKYFVCSSAGSRADGFDYNELKKRKTHITRTQCKASLKVKLLEDEGHYVVDRHILDHNHQLTRKKWSKYYRCERSITEDKGKVIEDMVSSGMRAMDSYRYMSYEAGGDDILGHTKKDHLNYVNRLKLKERGSGDAQTLVEMLYKQQSEETDFFFRVMLDDEGRLSSVFWRDSMMKEDYDIYGDVVVFDTTYSTNKYGLICAPIVGLNNHCKNIMFGVAFLANEETKSFEWLFEIFKKAMGSKCPVTIFTDQDQAITNAIATAFPNTKHMLCQWHLYQNAIKKFGRLKSDDVFKDEFRKCMSGCNDEAEFEECWNDMIGKYQLQNETWFKRLYALKDKWCTALNKDYFSAGILSSQRSEVTNSAMGSNVKKTTSLVEFHSIFKSILENWRKTEEQDEFKTARSIPTSTLLLTGLLKHASEVYTLSVFQCFEKEFMLALTRKCTLMDVDEVLQTYEICGLDGSGHTRYVMMDPKTDFVSCNCRKFEECGILCRHILKVLYHNDRIKIPEKYIMKRWTKFAKSSVWDKFHTLENFDRNNSLIQWRHEMSRKFYNLFLKCQDSDAARKKVDDAYEDLCVALSSLSNRQEQEETSGSHVSSTSNVTLDPARSVTKGRKKRIKGAIEKGGNKSTEAHVNRSDQPREFGSKTPNVRLF